MANEPVIIEMPKRMDGAALSGMRKKVNEAFDSGTDLIILDFQACDFMDSLGLSVIVSALKMSSKANKKLRLVHVGQEVRLLLQITRFDRICDIHDSMESAKA
ncbi:Anti-sigma factor antagonist [Sulfidibacter corallicola]|uniref:Anti-sigma factor antagonist n=1 Tax=Sulfidibacter corallicola TaxID=2818388 RepID=A0A8A4TH63_SULCO|nr:STAS domain-containing protein [Sulfidibacter corallicola]QTD48544.1 STAS domain-containing protein [Sulfidibacter corallicola]